MINNKFNSGGKGSNETHLSMYQNKQSPIAMKKMALRDVQNDNRSIMHNHPESFRSLGEKIVNGGKLSGIKRSNALLYSPNLSIHQSFKGIGVNEHTISASGESDSKDGKKRVLRHTSCAPTFSSISTGSQTTFSPVRSSLPILIEKPSNVDGSNLARVPPHLEFPYTVGSDGVIDEQRKERLSSLQKLLKHYDEIDKKGYIELLHGLPSSELSKLAIKLERRSMNLSIEEGKEIQRMKALNILCNLQ